MAEVTASTPLNLPSKTSRRAANAIAAPNAAITPSAIIFILFGRIGLSGNTGGSIKEKRSALFSCSKFSAIFAFNCFDFTSSYLDFALS